MRNVLYINHVSLMGGAEMSLVDLVTRLDTREFTPIVALPSPGPLAETFRRAGIAVRFVPMRRLKRARCPLTLLADAGNVAVNVARLRRLIQREAVALVHANSTTAHVYGGPAARLAGAPSVWHCRDLVHLGTAGRWLYRCADRVIAISSAVADHLRGCQTGRDKTALIPNGLDYTAEQPADSSGGIRREFGVRPEAFLVGMVAHLVPWKEHGLFIEAAATVAPEYPSVRFAVVGDDRFGDHPAYRTELEQRAEALGLRNRLFFAGYRRDMDAVMRDLDLLVHPASREPFGRVLLEAMRAGKPVVAADGGGPRDIIENGVSGVLVPPGDPGALARAVGGLIRDRAQASRLAAAGRARARQAFDIRQTVSRTESLYREVLAARESRH